MKIGIYGGSFDPVHVGHVNAALTFKEELSLDKIIVIPAYQPPHKKGLAMTPSEHRLYMCNLAFGNLEGFEVSDIEIKLRGNSSLHFAKKPYKIKLAEKTDNGVAAAPATHYAGGKTEGANFHVEAVFFKHLCSPGTGLDLFPCGLGMVPHLLCKVNEHGSFFLDIVSCE